MSEPRVPSPSEQLDILTALDEAAGFDTWNVFEPPDDSGDDEEEAA